jgi:hypothetical protein
MIANRDTHAQPVQPQGWPIYSYQNAANQARQDADRQRARVDQLTRRCRRLRAVTAWALTATVAGMAAAFALGGLLGYGLGSGLIGLVR